MAGVLTLRASIADADAESADRSACGFLRFRTVSGSLTDAEWRSLADLIPSLSVKCVSRRKSIRLEPVKVDWSVRETGSSKFGSLKISPSKKGFVQIEVVLDEGDHDGVVADLVNGEEILRSIADSVNWRAKQPAVPLSILSCLYAAPQADDDEPEDGDRFGIDDEEDAQKNDADAQQEDADNEEDDAEPKSAEEEGDDGRERDGRPPAAPPSSSSKEMEKRLFELRKKMNQARALNKKQIQEEEARLTETPAQRKKRLEREYRKRQQEQREQHPPTKEEKDAQLLHETAESVEAQRIRQSKKKPAAFGWDVFNQDALFRAYKKRTKHIPAGPDIPVVDDKDNELNYGLTRKPSNAAIDNMVSELNDTNKRRQKFSRRRQFYEDETVSYINERNRVFNKKVARFFDPYTQELKANIEKGTG